MNINLQYFSDRALTHLELAADTAICEAEPTDPWYMASLTSLHRHIVEERMRREQRKDEENG